MPTIERALADYIEIVKAARSSHTARTYAQAAKVFRTVLRTHDLDPTVTSSADISEDAITWLLKHLKDHSSATERLYAQAMTGFYQYLDAEKLANINMSRLKMLIKNRGRRPGVRLPQFPAEDITKLLSAMDNFATANSSEGPERLRALRDRAFLLTLADTGLRVHEACKLRRGDVDWNESRAVIIGKGDKQAVVRFSGRALQALKDYLTARAALDGKTGRPLASLPLFARHDRGAGSKIKAVTTATGRNIVHERVNQVLGETASGNITPHSLRHYFVTAVLRASGNLKMAQELARHTSIQVTERYAHLSNDELDRGYHEIFNAGTNKDD